MAINDEAVKLLNDLIRTSEDGKKGFQESAEKAEDMELKTLFTDRAAGCAQAASELQQLVRSLGGDPASDAGSLAGAAHRGWVKIKAAAGDNNIAVLEEVERGEDYAKAQYSKALKSNLPQNVREVIQRQYEGVLRNHDQIRELRDRYRATA